MSPEEKAAYDREYRAKNKARIAENKRRYAAENAGQERARVAAWHAANAARVAEIKREWKARNPDTDRRYAEVNREKVAARKLVYREKRRQEIAAKQREYAQRPEVKKATAAYKAAYRVRRPEIHRKTASQRRRGVSHATPAWANKTAIKAIYALARAQGLEVDHVIPLKSPLVCGLHVENNLQLLPPQENRRKGNRHAA